MFVRKIYLVAIVCLLSFVSCKKLLIKPDPESSAEQNFEIFWNDLNNGYPYFVEDNIDWQARYDKFRSQVSSSTSTLQLYKVFTQMLAGFSDGHLSVQYGNDNDYSNEKTIPNVIQLVRLDNLGTQLTSTSPISYYLNNYSNINASYLSDPQTVSGSDGVNSGSNIPVCTYGMIEPSITSKRILYVNMQTFETNYSIETLLQELIQDYSSDAMILDLRMNGGGSLPIMWNAISVFLPNGISEVKYAYNRVKVGPLPTNFGPENYFAIQSRNNVRYTKPIVVLVNRWTVSAAEHATMAMREIKKYNPKIKILGDYTFGATSFIVERTLPNGITYTLVNSKTWDINHVIVEKTGVKPDATVYLTADNIVRNVDDQLESAIDVINNNLF